MEEQEGNRTMSTAFYSSLLDVCARMFKSPNIEVCRV